MIMRVIVRIIIMKITMKIMISFSNHDNDNYNNIEIDGDDNYNNIDNHGYLIHNNDSEIDIIYQPLQ